MMFVKPIHFEVFMANYKKEQFRDEVLIYTIDKDYKVMEHAPVELFLESRNRVIIIGFSEESTRASRELMSVGTKKQLYAGWEPILNKEDLIRMIQRKIDIEKSKRSAYESDPEKYKFYKMYST